MISVPLNGSEVRTLKNHTTGAELNVIAARGMVFSSWRPTAEEYAALQSGKPVWVVIRGELVPEFHLQVGDRNEVVPPEIIKRAQKQDAIINSEIGQQVSSEQRKQAWIVEAVAIAYLAALICFGCLIFYVGLMWVMAEPLVRR